MNPDEASHYLVNCLPEFGPVLAQHLTDNDGELLIHLLMSDFGRFYTQHALSVPKLAARYWAAVETLAAEGDEDVKNAVHVSLIEWFAWGDEQESRALRNSVSALRPATRAMAAHFFRDL
jgi:hypothetical protein